MSKDCCDKEYPRLAQLLPIDFVNELQRQGELFDKGDVEARNKELALEKKIREINEKYNQIG